MPMLYIRCSKPYWERRALSAIYVSAMILILYLQAHWGWSSLMKKNRPKPWRHKWKSLWRNRWLGRADIFLRIFQMISLSLMLSLHHIFLILRRWSHCCLFCRLGESSEAPAVFLRRSWRLWLPRYNWRIWSWNKLLLLLALILLGH